MWRVTQIYKNKVPTFTVENTETGERKNCDFDWEQHAQIFADYLNEKEKNADKRG